MLGNGPTGLFIATAALAAALVAFAAFHVATYWLIKALVYGLSVVM